MKRTLPLLLFVFVSTPVLTNSASAAEAHEITQSNIKFSVPIKVIKPGDTVIFSNRDTVTHNIVSLTADFKFDLGEVEPGDSKSVAFDKEGVVDIQCTIHPGMKLTLFIFD